LHDRLVRKPQGRRPCGNKSFGLRRDCPASTQIYCPLYFHNSAPAPSLAFAWKYN
jgi:hypothetical protein